MLLNRLSLIKETKMAKKKRNLFFSISLLFRLLKSPALSHILEEYPQKDLLLSLAPFHIHFQFHWSGLWDLWPLCACFTVTKNNEQCVFLFTALQTVCGHGLSFIHCCVCLSVCAWARVCACVCTGFPNVFSSGHLSICSSSSWTSRIIGETESHWV